MRDAFLSQLVYQTYNGYVHRQFKKLEQDLRDAGRGPKWKHVMHLDPPAALGHQRSCARASSPVRVEEHRDRLLAIRDGGVPWEDVDAWRLDLHGDLDAAYASTRLPERPDYEAANRFLLKARRSAAQIGGRAMMPDGDDRRAPSSDRESAALSAAVRDVSGAHLYGFPSPDSDWDLRGVHVLPPARWSGSRKGRDTLTIEEKRDGFELDLVTHDVKKFFGLLLRRNGYVLRAAVLAPRRRDHAGARRAQGDRAGLRDPAPQPPLSRLRPDAVGAVREGEPPPGQAAPLRLPRAAHRHSSDADRRDRSQHRPPERGCATPPDPRASSPESWPGPNKRHSTTRTSRSTKARCPAPARAREGRRGELARRGADGTRGAARSPVARPPRLTLYRRR